MSKNPMPNVRGPVDEDGGKPDRPPGAKSPIRKHKFIINKNIILT